MLKSSLHRHYRTPGMLSIILVLVNFLNTKTVTAWSTLFAYQSVKRGPSSHPSVQHRSPHRQYNACRLLTSQLFGGVGTANTYSWKEEQFEIEVTITVPPNTAAKEIKFKCSSNSIDLRLSNDVEERILLDGARHTRGKICVDGTFWSITDGDRLDNGERQRQINVVIEKHFVPTSSAGGVLTYDQLTDFDWGGLYPDDAAEVTFREYEEAEELNVRDYAAKLGVDVDNIDMSKVDKTMFGAGLRQDAASPEDTGDKSDRPGTNLNITQATLDQLVKFGLAKEVVRQGDGTEYEMDVFSDDLERKAYSMLGKDVSQEELRDAGVVGTSMVEVSGEQTTASNIAIEDDMVEKQQVEIENDGHKEDSECIPDASESNQDEDDDDSKSSSHSNDPIAGLTVKKLKEILRQEGLKVSGTKSELQERLREHVQSLLEKGDE